MKLKYLVIPLVLMSTVNLWGNDMDKAMPNDLKRVTVQGEIYYLIKVAENPNTPPTNYIGTLDESQVKTLTADGGPLFIKLENRIDSMGKILQSKEAHIHLQSIISVQRIPASEVEKISSMGFEAYVAKKASGLLQQATP